MRIYLTIVCLLLTVPAYAVDTLQVTTPDPLTEKWRWTTYDLSSGLAGAVFDLYEDRDGNVWFATDGGVQRYDGLHWTTYTTADGLADDFVYGILQARDGAMWFGTRGGGISRFDPGVWASGDSGKGLAWRTYTTKDGLATDYSWSLLQTSDGAIWAGFVTPGDNSGTGGGISRFDGERWIAVDVPEGPAKPAIEDILESRDGSLWFTTRSSGILRLDNTGWTRYSAENGLPNDRLGRMMESRDGTLWFAHGVGGIKRFDPSLARLGQNPWKTYTTADGLPTAGFPGFRSVWQTPDGTIWCGVSGYVCRLERERWIAYTGHDMWGSAAGFARVSWQRWSRLDRGRSPAKSSSLCA